MTFARACPLAALSLTKLLRVDVEGESIALALDHEGCVHAFHAECTHADFDLTRNGGLWNAATAEVTCRAHAARFAVGDNGKVQIGPACIPLKIYRVDVRNGDVFVEIE